MGSVANKYPWFKKFESFWTKGEFPQSVLCTSPVGLGLVEYAKEKATAWVPQISDLLWICPEDNASVIKVEQIRSVIDFMRLKTFSGIDRLVVIESAEKMNINAQNALLKILEEPPENSFIWLLSSQPQVLLPTIRSRCQKLIFFAEFKETVPYFEKYFPGKSAEKLWNESHFGPLNISLERHETIQNLIIQLKEKPSPCRFAEQYLQKEKKNFDLLYDFFYAWVLDWYRFYNNGQLQRFLGQESWFEEYPFSALRAQKISRFVKKLVQLKKTQLQGIALNPELMLEDLMIDWRNL